jgi:TRAP-type C4-dicarboxylate transport system permease small subunit
MFGSGLALAGMMLVTVVDVVVRYTWNSPLGWSQELITYYLLPAAFFLALAHTLREDGHIKITILDRFLSARTRWVMSTGGHVLSAVLFALVAWKGFEKTGEAWRAGSVYPGYFSWPTWISLAFVPVGVTLLELRIVQRLGVLLKERKSSSYTIVDVIESTTEAVAESGA